MRHCSTRILIWIRCRLAVGLDRLAVVGVPVTGTLGSKLVVADRMNYVPFQYRHHTANSAAISTQMLKLTIDTQLVACNNVILGVVATNSP